jgi:glycosyltransferase involved in cell wall biosynthesis
VTKILYIVSSWPDANGFGGQLRAAHIGRSLAKVGSVTLLYVGSEAGDNAAQSLAKRDFSVLQPIQPATSPASGFASRLKWALSKRFMNLHGYVATDADQRRLSALLPQFDLVWVLNSRTPNIVHQWLWPRSHLDLDDIPSTYLRSVAASVASPLAWIKARLQQIVLARREHHFFDRFSTLSVCSTADRDYLGSSDRIHIIPNGFKRPDIEPKRALDPSQARVGFIGLYSYPPNREGMRWFLEHCWPGIQNEIPGVRLRLVGKDTDGSLRPMASDVDALGWVADPATEIATWSVMIVPIRVGGGTRIKLAEAFSRKCPTVSTSLGAFGYEVSHGRELLIADDPKDFTNACVDLIRHPARGAALSACAWSAFLKQWTWESIEKKVIAAAEDCLRRNRLEPGTSPSNRSSTL